MMEDGLCIWKMVLLRRRHLSAETGPHQENMPVAVLSGDRADGCIEREVKRAMRDLDKSMSGADNIHKIEQLQKKCTALYADMKRQEREFQKQKKRADTLQKEKDNAKTELNKATSMKEKLEKLSRETNNENRKLRVCCAYRRRGKRLMEISGRCAAIPGRRSEDAGGTS